MIRCRGVYIFAIFQYSCCSANPIVTPKNQPTNHPLLVLLGDKLPHTLDMGLTSEMRLFALFNITQTFL